MPQKLLRRFEVYYRLRYRSASFAECALGHISRLLGTKIGADITDISALRYQEDRLREKAAPKSINQEVRFLLKMLGDSGEVIRAHLKKTKQLKLTVHNFRTVQKSSGADGMAMEVVLRATGNPATGATQFPGEP